jgi:nitrogen fixation NifU-like protein
MYSPQLLDHFEHPRNAGEMSGADAHVWVENPACGDILELFAKREGDVICQVRFLAKGCVPAMACGSLLTELVAGRTVAEAHSIRREHIVEAIGGLPQASGHAAQLGMDALGALLQELEPPG